MLKVCREHPANSYAQRINAALSGPEKTFIKLFLGFIPTVYYPIIHLFIWRTSGLSVTFGQIMSLYEELNQAVERVMGPTSYGIIRRSLSFAKRQDTSKDDFKQFLTVYKTFYSQADPESVKKAENEIYLSMERVKAKASLELRNFAELNLDPNQILSTDNRISERSFSVLKSGEYRNTCASQGSKFAFAVQIRRN